MKNDDGGQAFPRGGYFGTHSDGSAEYESSAEGMSLRDWFAGQALVMAGVCNIDEGESEASAVSFVARHAYAIADAMLADRQKGGGE